MTKSLNEKSMIGGKGRVGGVNREVEKIHPSSNECNGNFKNHGFVEKDAPKNMLAFGASEVNVARLQPH